MSRINQQRGVGLVEILVALLVLALGVLGFVALQYRALEASAESTSRIEAMGLARDLSERIRINRTAFPTYQEELATPANQDISTVNCLENDCTTVQLADFDVAQVIAKARRLGMTMNIMDCQGNTNGRQCIYVAWGDTSATDGNGLGDCTDGTAYNRNSTCVILETYSL
ncbi:type IV pilus modification protein PilV [Acinetobacter haemolyticus]|uniref:type IV pilus modification protein PilV n=1 Tax=Acinetobacter haemolyticus TaxID=29430 RepID=UPI0034CE7FC7